MVMEEFEDTEKVNFQVVRFNDVPEHYLLNKNKTEILVGDVDGLIQHWSNKNDKAAPIETWYVGNVLKYMWRYPCKGSALGDLMKARSYLDRLITRIKLLECNYTKPTRKKVTLEDLDVISG